MNRSGMPSHLSHATGFRRIPRHPRKAAFLRVLRKLHAWVGLSGAAFGLLFGFTGILLNHRGVMKIEAGQISEHKVTVEFPEAPASPEALAQALAARFNVPMNRVKWLTKAGKPGRMGGAQVKVADQWTVAFFGHAHFALATYTPGNRTVELEQKDANFLQVLKRLHKGDGGQIGWILLSDAFAGALLFLTLSGILLWTRLAGPKLLAAGLAVGGLAIAILVVSRAW
ncbi:PepSY-associated TM helix domain-containing protein [Geothrix sp. PMB-07]|uniref:PepSY-associated TM helix domain-containing protein n=1 Tax=Geothrix sp. PMB-07 TaxID=3068640 RepID=UPI0027406186|nr:PepSY-associated TM helix domain-containing protein [Geothrix sp. PMB-07]WLT30478.1 PepSY-associated TM helix domain-containing protein [Geothrix sp. PMB-07]